MGSARIPTQWANTWAELARADMMLVSQVPIRAAIVEPGEDPRPPAEMAALNKKEEAHINTVAKWAVLAGRHQAGYLSLRGCG